MAIIADKLQQLHERLARACAAASRPVQSVTLLAVSKTFEADAVRAAFACGERRFGENYVQEGVDKIAALADVRSQIEWHLIGPLQSNKTRVVAEQFDWVHSIDRLKTAQRLSEQRPAHLAPLQVCLQVNISGEASKRGLRPDAVPALARAVAALPRLTLRGLMAVPEPAANFEAQRAPHRALHALLLSLRTQGLDQVQGQGQGRGQVQRPVLDTLSMGMSADLEAAVMEGATLVRIGSAIFGARPVLKPIGPPLV